MAFQTINPESVNGTGYGISAAENGHPHAHLQDAVSEVDSAELTYEQVREAIMTKVLGADIDFLTDNGDLDVFHYDPKYLEDGLLHTLVGDHMGGFHSESAATMLGLSEGSAATQVDHAKIESGNAKQRRPYRQWPFEPYKAPVVIGGKPKMHIAEDGSERSSPNGMFPREYDPTAVIRAISIAHSSRDHEGDMAVYDPILGEVIEAVGNAPMLDGGKMEIRMGLHPETLGVLSAHPITTNNGSRRMNMSTQEIHEAIIN